MVMKAQRLSGGARSLPFPEFIHGRVLAQNMEIIFIQHPHLNMSALSSASSTLHLLLYTPFNMALQTPSPTLYVSGLEGKTKKPGERQTKTYVDAQNSGQTFTPCSPLMDQCELSLPTI